jgi:hypothetical protein
MDEAKDDRIFLSTRIISAIVIPFLLLAFLILFFFPQLSGERFAWQVQPDLMALYIGSGYLGGSILFIKALLGKRWHRVAAGFPAITAFTISMLLATFLHWSRFDIHHLPFQLWLVLYIVTPVIVPWMWLHNRRTDLGTPESRDAQVPANVRLAVRILGLGLSLMALVGFIYPQFLMSIWVWKLTPLTARLLAGWGALLGVGNLFIARETRWSAWQTGVESIGIWHILFLIGAYFHREDFTGGSYLNWYVLSAIAISLVMLALYISMEAKRPASVFVPGHVGQ